MRRLHFTRPAVIILVMTFGLLPVAARALPSELPAAGLRLEAGNWLDHLARALGGLWKKATAEIGMSIDPDGRPDAAPADPVPGADTSKSICLDLDTGESAAGGRAWPGLRGLWSGMFMPHGVILTF